MDYLVIDLEGTCCDDNSIPLFERETIEIGAVVVSLDGTISGEFGSLVRPVRHPILTRFCTELTGITQADVDWAKPFPEVWQSFLQWVGPRQDFCSWGCYDLDQFRRDCSFHHLSLWFSGHCNLVKAFGRRVGNRKAARLLGVEPKGAHHRGLDDARNIAAVLVAMHKAGKRIKSSPIGV
jgi:inhibitor of KinA sporulation pathway (predicted exonuclease)